MGTKTRLLIARHGNTFEPGEVIKRVGITDLPLAASGLIQGRKLGTYLKQNDLIPDVIFTSKLKRTLQTAEQAQNSMGISLPLERLSMFNELDYGPDENQPETEVVARIGKDILQLWETQAIVPEGWKVNPLDIINNWMSFAERLRKVYLGKTCLVVTSNGIARFAPYLTGDFSAFSQQYSIKIATGALCLLENKQPDKTWNCLQWNIKPQT